MYLVNLLIWDTQNFPKPQNSGREKLEWLNDGFGQIWINAIDIDPNNPWNTAEFLLLWLICFNDSTVSDDDICRTIPTRLTTDMFLMLTHAHSRMLA